MKKNAFGITAILAVIILSVGCSSEFEIKETEVPKEVLAAFQAKYPAATAVEWVAEKEKGNFYFEAEWKENGKKMEVHITPDGSSVAEDK